MSNFKRRKPRRQVACRLCTQHRWKGNSASKREGRHKPQEHEARRVAEMEQWGE
jgi:hypothetical protein